MTTKWREADAGAAFGSRLHLAGYQLWTRIFEDDVIFEREAIRAAIRLAVLRLSGVALYL